MFNKHSLIAVGMWLWSVTAQAGLVTYDFTLTPTALGSPTPVFGISSLPAGPFLASLTLTNPLPPSLPLTNEFANVEAFSATIGTQTWSLGDLLSFVYLSTDATGNLSGANFSALILPDTEVGITFNTTLNVGWVADETGGCGLSGTLPLVVFGQCIGGDPSSVQVSVRRSVLEPATLALLALGLAGLAASRGRRN
jgi:PEP-CTERM motif